MFPRVWTVRAFLKENVNMSAQFWVLNDCMLLLHQAIDCQDVESSTCMRLSPLQHDTPTPPPDFE
jgi:hypothetical protein